MANVDRVTRRSEAGNLKGKGTSGSWSGKTSTTVEASGLRRSGRETGSSKSKVVASPLSTKKASSSSLSNQNTKTPMTPSGSGFRRSERLEKRTPETNLQERKSKRAAQVGRSLSPTRRSERVKSLSNSSPVGLKKSNLSPDSINLKRKKERKEKSVNQLTEETKEDNNGNEQDVESARVIQKRKTMHARDYKALLKPQIKKKLLVQDEDQVLNLSDKFSKEDENPCTTGCSDQADQGFECSGREEKGPDCSDEKERGLAKQCDDVADNYRATVETCTEETLRECGNMELPPKSPKYLKDAPETEASKETQDIRSSHSSVEEVCSGSVNCRQNLADSLCLKERGELKAGKASVDTNECRSLGEAQELPLDVHEDDGCNTCFTCKLGGGELLCCEGKGCKRSCHLHCLDPPLADFPVGTWYCIGCVKKKIKFGVQLASKGIESIWDAREIDVIGNKEKLKQKQYYVKFKGFAHVHNRWMTESELLHESPSLIATFIQMSQFVKWKPEWSVPQRLLQKRRLISPKQLNEFCGEKDGNCLDFQYEWLVKWCGLDYGQVTWELENSQFLNTPEAQRLKIAYENRHKAKSVSPGVKNKGSFVKLSQPPAGIPLGNANNCLDSINKLREFWFKGQNAVLVEDLERMLKVIQFIVSLESSISHPILIIASSDELLGWEREFLHLVPSINVVVYSGNNDVRQCLRKLENFDEQAKTTFQVLVTTREVLTEDLEVLVRLEWEIIIIDECQRSNDWVHFGHFKRLTTEMRVLLVRGQLKETVDEYCNLLSLLYCRGRSVDRDSLKTISSHDIVSLKNKISRYMVHECKSDPLQFVEFWVPAQASNVQLEQYCATLSSNSLSLCSTSKKDPVEALCDIIIRNRKCCDHPYIVDPSVQEMMLKGLPLTEYLDVGIKASGKLQLLDSMLLEIKKRDLRVLILFQSVVGIGKDPICIGDILDDYMRQRFGSNSYERIDVFHSKKQAALDNFNNKESGRFVLLLEARACSLSIKLASVDAVIIYGSDWIPIQDFKNLQKIAFRSQFNQMKVFRFYSPCTLEEKVLIHAKKNMTLDSPHNMFRNSNHKLLMWGTSSLFKRLEDFHCGNGQGLDTSIRSQDAHLRDVLKEFSAILDDSNNSGSSIISTAEHNGIKYSSDNLLLGETEVGLSDEVPPHMYWTRLLEGKNPQWKYVSGSTQRNRKRAHHMDHPAKKVDVEIAEDSRKRKRLVKDQGYIKFQQNNAKTLPGNKEGKENLHDVQKSVDHTLQSEVSKLCNALQLSDDVKGMVRKFLAYIMTSHHVPDKPTTIIQAFQMALCWTAASLMKHKIDHKASITHAKEHLGYECTEEEAELVYSKLRCLKSVFLFHSGILKAADYSTSGTKDGTVIAEMVNRDVSRSLKKIEKKCNKQMSKLLRKQEEERKELLAICEEDRAVLEKSQKLDAAVIRFSNECNATLRDYKLNSLDDEYKKRFEENEEQKELRLRCLDEIQLAARKKEEKRASSWVEEVNSWAHLEILDKLSLDGFHKLVATDSDIATQIHPDLIEFVEDVNECLTIPETDTRGIVACQDSSRISDVRPSDLSRNVCRKISGGTKTNDIKQCHGSDGLIKDIEHISEQPQDSAALRSSDGPENFIGADKPLNELNSEKPTITPIGQAPGDIMPGPSTLCQPEDNNISEIRHSVKTHGDKGFPVISSSNDDLVDNPVNQPSFGVDNPPGTSSNMADRQCPSGQPKTVGASDCVDDVTSLRLPRTVASVGSGDYIPPSATLSMPDVSVPSEVSEIASDAVTCCDTRVDNIQKHGISAGTSNATIVSQQGGADCTNIQDSCYQGTSCANLCLAEPLSQSGSFQANKAPEVESSSRTISSKIPRENVQSFSMQAGAQQSYCYDGDFSGVSHPDHITTAAELTTTLTSTSFDNALINDLPNQEPIAEPRELMQMQMSTSSPVHVVGSRYSTCEVPVSGPNAEPRELMQMLMSTSSPVHVVGSRYFTCELPVSRPLTSPGACQPQNSSEVPRPSQVVQAPMQLSENIMNHASHTPTSQLARFPSPIYSGPLQNELERIRKAIDDNNKLQQEKKVQLDSDCEKEIAEVVTHIRQKYKVKYQDFEAEYGAKSKELERNHEKVLMNKILAEAFKSKCMDVRPPSAPGLGKDRNSHFRQQLALHLSSQQTSEGPSSATISLTDHQTSSSQTTAGLRLQHIVPPTISHPAHTMQGIRHSSAPFQSIPPRPADVNHLSPPTTTQVGVVIRAMAPALQHNRSSVSMATTRIPLHSHAISNQPSPPNPPPSLPVFVQLPSQIQAQASTSGGLPNIPVFSPTAVPQGNRPVINSSNILPELVHMGSDHAVQSKTSTQDRMQNTSACNAEADIVCLSDDD